MTAEILIRAVEAKRPEIRRHEIGAVRRQHLEAVLALVQDKDEDVRRSAIEILNQTKDERAVDSLIKATRDADWTRWATA